MKKVDLTFDQGKERQAQWRKLYKEVFVTEPNDKDLLNWLSMNFHISRKVVKIEEI
jgi:hypothetical protein